MRSPVSLLRFAFFFRPGVACMMKPVEATTTSVELCTQSMGSVITRQTADDEAWHGPAENAHVHAHHGHTTHVVEYQGGHAQDLHVRHDCVDVNAALNQAPCPEGGA